MIDTEHRKSIELSIRMGNMDNPPDFKVFRIALNKLGGRIHKLKDETLFVLIEPGTPLDLQQNCKEDIKYLLKSCWDYKFKWLVKAAKKEDDSNEN